MRSVAKALEKNLSIKFHYLFSLLCVLVLSNAYAAHNAFAGDVYTLLSMSPDGDKLAFADSSNRGLFVFFLRGNKTWSISQGIGAAYGVSWSANSRYVGFKNFYQTVGGQVAQAPCLFDTREGRSIQLHAPIYRCGVPSMSEDGKIVFTIGRKLVITDMSGFALQEFDLPAYANLTPISPDSRYVIYNDAQDRLWLVNVQNGSRRQLTHDGTGYFNPLWSPNSDRFVASTLDGRLVIYDIHTGELRQIGRGQHPVWTANGERIIYSRTDFLENREVTNIDLMAVDARGQHIHNITDTKGWEDFPALSVNNSRLYYSDLRNGTIKSANLEIKGGTLSLSTPEVVTLPVEAKSFVIKRPVVVQPIAPVEGEYFDIPYIHQKYDMPSWFNGGWACGGTAAVMCISYYGILKHWPAGNSGYGRYVCDIYTYNGYTYDIPGLDPNGNEGYGAYGFIIQDNWRDTKGYMARYARQHGLASGVDWSPSRSKLRNEVHARMPFVLLTSLTSAGHYISVIGYEDEATTIVVNDPWGDKNRGYPNYYGRRAKYDWPGYTNGHRSIEKAWCFIYFRGNEPDLMVKAAQSPDTVTINQSITFSGNIINRGMKASEACQARIYFSDNSRIDSSDRLLASAHVPALAVQDTFRLDVSVTIPDSLLSAKYAIGVVADADSQLLELNETNNTGYHVVVVRGYAKIFGLKPAENEMVTETHPHIFAYFTDRYAHIDTANVHLFVDGIEVTKQAQVRWNSISYLPEQALIVGQHSILLRVGNKAGFVATQEWTFRIETATNVAKERGTANPGTFRLFQNYPNPFNRSTSIAFYLPQQTSVQVDIFSLSGALVKNIINQRLSAGRHLVLWDGSDANGMAVASGIYFYRLTTNSLQLQKRLLLLK